MTIHDFQVKTSDGQDVSLSRYQGKALLIVNTASECGYTPQYKGLEELYQAYRARGLEVLAFPSNDFGGQEPGTDAEIRKFCQLRFQTTFPLFAKIKVKGPGADPLYRHLAALPENGGKVVAHLESSVEPTSAELKRRIEAVLPRP
jgi:glutathione peroxidase